jgi:hypothetical protein
MATDPIGYKLVRKDGSMARFFVNKDLAVTFHKHPATASRYPDSHVHAVYIDTRAGATADGYELREEVVS